jgi:DNA-binding response OmpR family regulator
MSQKASILLVEDDENLGSLVEEFLSLQGYSTHLAANGEEGLKMYLAGSFDLCILDVMMPKKDGFTLAADIRNLDQQVPIIFLTARGLDQDRIKGFKSGCDDYITKPFSSEELVLRIEAILKRCSLKKSGNGQQKFALGKYIFDPVNLLLSIEDNVQKLTVKEAALLKLLCQNVNNLLSRDKAQTEVWGTSDYFIGRSMDVFITRLRKYLRHDPDVAILNVHGAGFKLEVKSATMSER